MLRSSRKNIREDTSSDLDLFGPKAVRLPLSDSMRLMLAFTYKHIKQFPNYEKHSGLAAEIRANTWLLQELILTARQYQKYRPTEARAKAQITRLERLDARHEVLKMQVRTAADIRYISLKVYGEWAVHLVDIGRQIGGWLKSVIEAKGSAL